MISRVALVWACCALVLSACSGSEQAGKLPPLPSPSSSASPSPSATASSGDAKAVLVALAKQYYEERNRAVRTGDTHALRRMSTSSCDCLNAAKGIESAWRTGSIASTNYYQIQTVAFSDFNSRDIAFVNVTYLLGEETFLDSAGKAIKTYPPNNSPQTSTIEFHLISGKWMVAGVVRN